MENLEKFKYIKIIKIEKKYHKQNLKSKWQTGRTYVQYP